MFLPGTTYLKCQNLSVLIKCHLEFPLIICTVIKFRTNFYGNLSYNFLSNIVTRSNKVIIDWVCLQICRYQSFLWVFLKLYMDIFFMHNVRYRNVNSRFSMPWLVDKGQVDETLDRTVCPRTRLMQDSCRKRRMLLQERWIRKNITISWSQISKTCQST